MVGSEAFSNPSSHNANRIVLSRIGLPPKCPEFEWVDVRRPDNRWEPLPIICPIAQIEKLVNEDDDRFVRSVRGAPADVPSFWHGMRNTKIFANVKDYIDPSCTLAVKIHCDGAPSTKTDSMMTISWSTLHGTGNTKETRYVYTSVPYSVLGPGALDKLLERLAWAFNALIVGRLPPTDFYNKPLQGAGRELAKGWKLAPILTVCDWEFFSTHCYFPTGTSVPEMCWGCRASTDGELCYLRMGRDAGWRRTMKDHASYIASRLAQGQKIATLFMILTMFLEGFLPDMMHSYDGGVVPECIGNLLWEIIELHPFGATQDANANGLHLSLKEFYKRRKTNKKSKIDGKITVNRIRTSGDWPLFKCKAAAGRHLLPWCIELATRFNSGSDHDNRRLALFQCLQSVVELLQHRAGRFLTEAQKRELFEISQSLFSCYSLLANEALTQGVRKWKIKPKAHLCQHLFEIDVPINPTWVWLYSDEDLQQHVKRIAIKSHPSHVTFLALLKWAVMTFEA